MKKFIARFTVVLLVVGLIVGVGFGLQGWQPVASFFSKDGASPAGATVPRSGGDELAHPDEDKSDFEQWPDLGETDQLLHAMQVMLPTLTVVVAFDMSRRRARNAKRASAVRAVRVVA